MLKRNVSTLLVGCVLGPVLCCTAQDGNDLYSNLEQFFSQLQNKQVIPAEFNDVQIKEADPNRLLRFLEAYATSADVSVRWQAHGLEAKVAEFHGVGQIRHQVVERLANALVSKNEIDRTLHAAYSELLVDNFRGEDFTEDAKAAVLKALHADNPRKELIRVCGVAQLKEGLPRLAELLIDEVEFETKWQRIRRKWYYTRGWNARLARARMGIGHDINKCVQLVESVEDIHLKVYHLLPAVAYIRRPQGIQYLQEYLNSNMVLKTDGMEEPVAAFVLDLLAECLKDFPIEKRRGRGYGQNEIERAREWMAEQKEWEIRR